MKLLRSFSVLLLAALVLPACSDNKDYETSICALADVSGTYAKEKKNMVKIIKAGLIPELRPGDGIIFMVIDSNSYTKKNIISKMTMDYRPTESQKQKLAFSNSLDKFAKGKLRSRHTDISGAMMYCSERLKETKSGTQMMIIFSDMKEELPKGVKRKFEKDEFKGIHVAAMNVIKLGKDQSNPQKYRKRMKNWKKKIEEAGAKSWQTLLDAKKISEYIESVKS